jgi:hypothetical protein
MSQNNYPRIIRNAAYGRVYECEEGIFFPSVTTVLKYGLPTPEFLLKYMIETSRGSYERHLNHSGEASEVGTAVHELIERILLGEEITISSDPLDYVSGRGYYPTQSTLTMIRKGLQSFMAFWDNMNPEVESTEEMLFSTTQYKGNYCFPFAGRCDLTAMIDGERWLLDFKTSKQCKGVFNYGIQLTMYKMLWDDMHPDKPIDRMGVVWCKKDFLSATPPRSVLEPIEYEYQPEMVKSIYGIFQQNYDGFTLGQPRLKAKPPRVFSLAEGKV